MPQTYSQQTLKSFPGVLSGVSSASSGESSTRSSSALSSVSSCFSATNRPVQSIETTSIPSCPQEALADSSEQLIQDLIQQNMRLQEEVLSLRVSI